MPTAFRVPVNKLYVTFCRTAAQPRAKWPLCPGFKITQNSTHTHTHTHSLTHTHRYKHKQIRDTQAWTTLEQWPARLWGRYLNKTQQNQCSCSYRFCKPAIRGTKTLQMWSSERTASRFDVATYYSVSASVLTY